MKKEYVLRNRHSMRRALDSKSHPLMKKEYVSKRVLSTKKELGSRSHPLMKKAFGLRNFSTKKEYVIRNLS
jgi:hypothetical protein